MLRPSAIAAVFTLTWCFAPAYAENINNPDACGILVYRDVFQNLLTDWPEAGSNRPRSPRYVFGIQDPITIEVKFRREKPSPVIVEVVETTTLEEHDVHCDFYAIVDGWYTYRLRSSEFIYLVGDPPQAPPGTHFQMVGEEVLNFSVQIMPECRVNWMVDRGERASGGAVFYAGATGDRTIARFPGWYENGDHDFGNVVAAADLPVLHDFINNAGDNPPSGLQADLLHWTSHGDYNGGLYDNDGNLLFDPLTHGQSWNQDAEYVVLDACNELTNIPPWEGGHLYSVHDVVVSEGRYYVCVTAGTSGSATLTGTGAGISDGSVTWNEIPNPGTLSDPFSGFIGWETMTVGNHCVHGILGAVHPVASDIRAQLSQFYAELVAGSATYLAAYSDGMSSGTPQPWAAIIDPTYETGDRFKEVQRDGFQGHRLVRFDQ